MSDQPGASAEDAPKTQTEPQKGGIGGGRKTAIGTGGNSDDNRIGPLAQQEARRLGQNCIGTEILLLAVIRSQAGCGSQALASMGVTLEKARLEVESITSKESGFVNNIEIPYSPLAKDSFLLSWNEARELGHNFIGSEHILLGLISDKRCTAARVLESLGVDLDELHKRMLSLMGVI